MPAVIKIVLKDKAGKLIKEESFTGQNIKTVRKRVRTFLRRKLGFSITGADNYEEIKETTSTNYVLNYTLGGKRPGKKSSRTTRQEMISLVEETYGKLDQEN